LSSADSPARLGMPLVQEVSCRAYNPSNAFIGT
jgi:hypothetical protein